MTESKWIQRVYKPINPQKYKGDPTKIINRSSWETMFCKWADSNKNILEWSSENTIIPYYCPTDSEYHRYFVDFRIVLRDSKGIKRTYLVEIKPYAQTQKPEQQQRRTKRFITESLTYVKNQAKWNAAKRYAKQRGWEFIVITEKELGIAK